MFTVWNSTRWSTTEDIESAFSNWYPFDELTITSVVCRHSNDLRSSSLPLDFHRSLLWLQFKMVGGRSDSTSLGRDRQGVMARSKHLTPEIYFLIAKFLSNGPCEKALEALREEIEKHNVSIRLCLPVGIKSIYIHVDSWCQNELIGWERNIRVLLTKL